MEDPINDAHEGVPTSRLDRVISAVAWRTFEILGIALPLLVAATLSEWWLIIPATVVAILWAADSIRIYRSNRRVSRQSHQGRVTPG